MISRRTPQPEEVHRSAAVDLGDIVLQAASALRANRGIVREKPARAQIAPNKVDFGRDVIADLASAYGSKKETREPLHSPRRQMRTESALFEPAKRGVAKSWQNLRLTPKN